MSKQGGNVENYKGNKNACVPYSKKKLDFAMARGDLKEQAKWRKEFAKWKDGRKLRTRTGLGDWVRWKLNMRSLNHKDTMTIDGYKTQRRAHYMELRRLKDLFHSLHLHTRDEDIRARCVEGMGEEWSMNPSWRRKEKTE